MLRGDALHYAPGSLKLTPGSTALEGSVLNGGGGTDRLYVTSAVTTEAGKPTVTWIYMVDGGGAILYAKDPTQGSIMKLGEMQSIEKVFVTGPGTLEYQGQGNTDKTIDVTGTDGNDVFWASSGDEIMRGGLGNDRFRIGSPNPGESSDVVYSGQSDADEFNMHDAATGSTTIVGFNGAGQAGGDRLYVRTLYNGNGFGHGVEISEQDGFTTFTTHSEQYEAAQTVRVDAGGLLKGVDYFFT